MQLILWMLAAYLIGAIPFGVLAARLFGGRDPRSGGSGNIGATNVLRMAGKKAGVFTLVCDALKGYLPTLGAMAVFPDAQSAALVGMATFLGHLFPVYLRFRGGKGIATGAGVFLALSPGTLAIALAVFGAAVWKWRWVSLGSVLSGVALAPGALVLGEPHATVAAAALTAVLSIWKHRSNIRNLIDGTEDKLGEKDENDP